MVGRRCCLFVANDYLADGDHGVHLVGLMRREGDGSPPEGHELRSQAMSR